MIFGFWKMRAWARVLQNIAEYCGAPYQMKYYEQGDAPDYDKSDWTSKKDNLGLDFPNLPYMIHGDLKLTETVAIMTYIAAKYKPELLGETPEEKSTVTMVMCFLANNCLEASK